VIDGNAGLPGVCGEVAPDRGEQSELEPMGALPEEVAGLGKKKMIARVTGGLYVSAIELIRKDDAQYAHRLQCIHFTAGCQSKRSLFVLRADRGVTATLAALRDSSAASLLHAEDPKGVKLGFVQM